MKSTNYFIIQGWMVNELELKGNNLLVFAIVYGFSQDGQSDFEGSLSYLCKSTGASKNTVIKSLNELIELGYITKQSLTRNNIVFNTYSQNEQVVQKLVHYGAETGTKGSSETGTNNTNTYNIDYNKLILYFNKVFTKNAKVVNPEIRTAFNKRLKQGYSKEDIMKVIDNCSHDTNHKDNDYKYITLEFLSRPKIFERYASQEHKKAILPVQQQNGDIFYNQ